MLPQPRRGLVGQWLVQGARGKHVGSVDRTMLVVVFDRVAHTVNSRPVQTLSAAKTRDCPI